MIAPFDKRMMGTPFSSQRLNRCGGAMHTKYEFGFCHPTIMQKYADLCNAPGFAMTAVQGGQLQSCVPLLP